jgi:hypothetical protein
MKPSVLVAAGCSWVAARAIDTDPSATDFDYTHVEDTAFVDQYSFAGILREQLGLDKLILLAVHGSNNTTQAHKLIDFIESHKDEYDKIFVLWGLTSIYRWEMYSSVTKQTESCMVGGYYKNQELADEVKHYFIKFFNEDYEVQKLTHSVLLISNYLTNNKIDHLFVNSFQGRKLPTNLTKHFYKADEQDNDLLSFLCKKNSVKLSQSSVPWLNLLDKELQYSNKSVKALQELCMLDRATAHPTVEAHQLIATELYDYIQGK